MWPKMPFSLLNNQSNQESLEGYVGTGLTTDFRSDEYLRDQWGLVNANCGDTRYER